MIKLYLFLTVCVIALSYTGTSQCPTRTTTTKWDAPNTSNTWNWTNQFYNDVYIKNRSFTTVPSPFFNPNATFQNPNLSFLQSPAVKDMDPDDGWELLVKDMGNNSNLPATAVTNPFFALYNRYVGTIRLFFMVTDPLAGNNNGATVSMMFDGGAGRAESSLMAHASTVVSPLDRFEKGIISRMPNKYSNENDYWLFADFPTSYDPCTCLFNSQITFTVNLIETTNASLEIKLTGTTTGTIKQVITPSPGGVSTSLASNSVVNWVNGLVKSGNDAYKSWQGFQTAVTNFQDFLIAGQTEQTKKQKIQDELSSLIGFTKELPFVGSLAGIFDFLIGGGKKAAKSAGPMAFNANFKHEISGSATGTLELSTVRGFRSMYTPGANNGGASSAIPTYDNVLGVFALLETPRIEYLDYQLNYSNVYPVFITVENPNYDPGCRETPDDPYRCIGNDPLHSIVIGQGVPRIRQFKLSSPIKYAINPAANMQLLDIQAALVIIDERMIVHPMVTWGNLNTYTTTDQKYINMGYEWETNDKVRTPFLPLTCIGNTSILQSYASGAYGAIDFHDNVFVKIKATFRRNDAGPTTQDVIYISTFKTSVSRSPQDPGNLEFYPYSPNRVGPDQITIPPYEYPNAIYYLPSQYIFPSPIPGIAGVQNPSFPGYCNGTVPPQTDVEVTNFCNNRSLYNPFAPSARIAYEDEKRPTEPQQIPNGVYVTNFPNPFEKTTKITFSLAAGAATRIYVTNQNGQLIKTLVDKHLAAGTHTMTLNGEGLASGVYYYTLQTDNKKITKKIIKL